MQMRIGLYEVASVMSIFICVSVFVVIEGPTPLHTPLPTILSLIVPILALIEREACATPIDTTVELGVDAQGWLTPPFL